MRLCLALLLALPLVGADFVTIPAAQQRVQDPATGFHFPVQTGEFTLSRTEVTQAGYERLMGANPSRYRGPDRPVENVSWFDAIAYANRLSRSEKLSPCYRLPGGERQAACTGYRLPTSAEWAAAFGTADPAGFRSGSYQDPAPLLAREREGTKAVGSGRPNAYGVFNMGGNVWEWCEDWYSPEPALDAIRDPQGPPGGLERVIRGGSFLTGGSQWNKGLLSSRPPESKSRFTGFRLARTVAPALKPALPDAAWLAQFQKRPEAMAPIALNRSPEEIRRSWMRVLGAPDLPARPPSVRAIRALTDPTWNGQLLDLNIDPGFPTRLLVAEPVRKPAGRLPVIIVPYYDVDTPAGADIGGRRFTRGGTRAFARLAAQRGMLAVAVKWYGEADGEGYDEAVFHHAARHPDVTPMGKWVFDLQRVVDYLLTRPDVDPSRIGIIGHSLGGKMALYGSAFEPRIRVIVSSEPGIGLKFSNYQDFWYLGPAIGRLPAGADHHELLALIAPRAFLLIAGESADGDKSWPFLAAAQKLYPQPEFLGLFNHRTGHSPTEESVQLAMEWLERFLRK